MEDSYLIISILILLVFILLFTTCNEDSFDNIDKIWNSIEDNKGYPVPQGNLSNYRYGTTDKAQNIAQKNWKSVLNTYRENFTPPQPNTILHSVS